LENLIGIDYLGNLGINWISDIKICFVEICFELNWFTIMSSGRIS
jgi:nucleosome binding factor SPN SPT16 subunit